MNIYGIGIDVVDTPRIEKSIEQFGAGFLDRIFTPRERDYCDRMRRPGPHYAARFAAKEAVAKALGTGFGETLGWTDVEVVRDPLGKPDIILSGAGKKFAEDRGISSILISLSHSEQHAAANAVALCGA